MWKSKLQKMWNFSWNWASNFHVCTQKHCKSGFSKKKVHRDSVSLVTSIISRIFCSLSFSAILLQFNLCKSYFGSFGLLRSIWITGITDLILKLLFKDSKSLAIVMPSFIMPFKSKGYWLVLLEELCQFYWILFLYQFWFHYLICYREFNNIIRSWDITIFILPHFETLGFCVFLFVCLEIWELSERFCEYFLHDQVGVTCSGVDDTCSICQAEFQKVIFPICQRVFSEDYITLLFYRENIGLLCKSEISDHINKWKDGATSSHLQM